ncbi:MAG: hypothetical protein EXR62_03995 [Chloroflexi bacterium]|nr:hypothetical protein [Chloroflexota bacterium]
MKWSDLGYYDKKYGPTQDGKIDIDDVTTASANWHVEMPGCTGTVILKTYFLGDKAVALRQGGQLRYLHTDHLGSTSLLTGDSGQVLAASGQRYMPFGKGRAGQAAPLPSERAFTGQALDASTGLMYYGSRYYDPYFNRHMGRDSLCSPGFICRAPVPHGIRRFLAKKRPYETCDRWHGNRLCIGIPIGEHYHGGNYWQDSRSP